MIAMANLQIKGIQDDLQDDLYERIKEMAASENRSLCQQVLYLIKGYLASKGASRSRKSPARILLELSGSWENDRDAGEIISDIKRGRKNPTKAV